MGCISHVCQRLLPMSYTHEISKLRMKINTFDMKVLQDRHRRGQIYFSQRNPFVSDFSIVEWFDEQRWKPVFLCIDKDIFKRPKQPFDCFSFPFFFKSNICFVSDKKKADLKKCLILHTIVDFECPIGCAPNYISG